MLALLAIRKCVSAAAGPTVLSAFPGAAISFGVGGVGAFS
jgi:hypothetical protein